jgi:hypothetical protein
LKTCYTAIFGNYDDLKEPLIVTKGWKYICYTDQNFKSDVWEIRNRDVMDIGPAKTARWYKINFDKCVQTDLSLWIDGTFVVNTDLNKWWRRFKEPFTAVRHPFDDCIYKDADACLSGGKGGVRSLLERQVAFYKAIGIKRNGGLIASGVLMRRNNEAVRKFCATWWEQVRRWSNRDQIAYGYANHQHPNLINMTEWDYTKQEEFIHIPHLNKPHRKERIVYYMRNYGEHKGTQG